jgi:hypothetical protein
MSLDLVWQSIAWRGLEHAIWSEDEDTMYAEGQALHVLPEGVTWVQYKVGTDQAGHARHTCVTVEFEGQSNHITLRRESDGTWSDQAGPRPDLNGCTDVDISTSPLTNTLPIRRLDLADGKIADLRVAYIDVPSLQVTAEHQRYTALWHEARTAGYRYESGSFRADLTVDEHGLVTNYPDLWTRRDIQQ